MVTPVTIVSGSYHISEVLCISTSILRILFFRDVMLHRGVVAPDVSKQCHVFIFKDELVHFVHRKFIDIVVITSNISKLKYFLIMN
jgi:hypothetical protein